MCITTLITMRKSGWLKVIGLAGVAGVAATGVVVTRDQRRRNAYTPDEVRARLQKRLADTTKEEHSGADPGASGPNRETG